MVDNIYRHTLRLNLDKESHLQLHHKLMNLDEKKYKSKNDFMIQALQEYFEKEAARQESAERRDLWYELKVLREEMKSIKESVVKDLMSEMMKIMMTAVTR